MPKKYLKASYLAPASLAVAMAGFFLTLGAKNETLKVLRAFFESAMIGGLADWFAVVALFRHPFNIPIPHTSIIKKNRRKITSKIVEMLETQWLTKDAIARRLGNYDFSDEIMKMITSGSNEEISSCAEFIVDAAIERLKTEKINPAGIINAFESEIARMDMKTPIFSAIESNDEMLRRFIVAEIETWLMMPETTYILKEKIKNTVFSYAQKYEIIKTAIEFGETLGILNYDSITQELVKAIHKELECASSDEKHEINIQLSHAIKNVIEKIKQNPATDMILPALIKYGISKIDVNGTLVKILDENREPAAAYIASSSASLALELARDASAKKRFNTWMGEKISEFINNNHSEIGNIVRNNINSVNDDELSAQIEEKVGDDLQYIRLNGAIVGGLVGTIIYLARLFLV